MKNRLESHFDIAFTAGLAQREKQIQQSYRPLIGIHKWFARRPGTVFRSLLLAEFNGDEAVRDSYWRAHSFSGVIADPFMGGGTTVYEANRLGLNVVAGDINPMAYWIVRQAVAPLDLGQFRRDAEAVIADVEREVGGFYQTRCECCGQRAQVKYFIWVKSQSCPSCGTANDLFPGFLLAEAVRHPRHVVACSSCGCLNVYDTQPTPDKPSECGECGKPVTIDGTARRGRVTCFACSVPFDYPSPERLEPPRHRLWAIEYHCAACKEDRAGRFFKRPDAYDMKTFGSAADALQKAKADLPIPEDEIPDGDETKRLHRWGYRQFKEMFNDRQLLGLGILLKRILETQNEPTRHALLTVFSDILRYQNMLCRYDTYALKCQDIFSVHGFPVGLVQCENNLLGIPSVGSGGYRHFVEKFVRAKKYCEQPFETMITLDGKKRIVPIMGEQIRAKIVGSFPSDNRDAWLSVGASGDLELPEASLDGVFTDPPYYDNVQYAELMDFCYAWLRIGLKNQIPAFEAPTTKAHSELTGNDTMKRGIKDFTAGLSKVFCRFGGALKPNAPFVFTYHHNDPEAYAPLVVAILDAGLNCTDALPTPGEMSASMHIANSNSSVLDTVFVCRKTDRVSALSASDALRRDSLGLQSAGMKLREGDMRCLEAGHIARIAINKLYGSWPNESLDDRIALARKTVATIRDTEMLPSVKTGRSDRTRKTVDQNGAAL